MEVFGFLLRKGAMRPVSSSRLFCHSLVFAKASDWWSSLFFFFLLEPFVESIILSVGVAQAFFFFFSALFLGAFVSLLSSEASFPIHFAFGFGLFAALHGFLRLLTFFSVFLHQFWRLCVVFAGRGISFSPSV